MKIKPQKLNKGDTIGIISPAGAINNESMLIKAVQCFERLGFSVKIAQNVFKKENYLAGSDDERLSDLIGFFQDKEVKAIICSRGGYGTLRLLDKIDFEVIKNNPKIFVGYSDITALLSSFYDKAGLVTFHGPLAASDFGAEELDKFTIDNFLNFACGQCSIPHKIYADNDYYCVKEGCASGELVGGNLAVLCSMLGTKYFPDVANKILFFEDIGEPIYKIDRMLTQLRLTGVFDSVSGVIFGDFTYKDNDKTYKAQLQCLIQDIMKNFSCPIGVGFPIGHEKRKLTLPIGVVCNFSSIEGCIEIKESFIKAV